MYKLDVLSSFLHFSQSVSKTPLIVKQSLSPSGILQVLKGQDMPLRLHLI